MCLRVTFNIYVFENHLVMVSLERNTLVYNSVDILGII